MSVVIVTGSRSWAFPEIIWEYLNRAMPKLVVEGGCGGGADRAAREWAKANGVTNKTFRANWERHGKAAGPLRNGLMLRSYPTALVLAFPLDGNGTRDCISQAKRMGMSVHVYDPFGNLISSKEALTP